MNRLLALVLALGACTQLPDTVGEAAPEGTVWALQSINDAPVTYSATLRLFGNGRVRGRGPCNTFSGRQDAPLPWVEFTDLTAGRRTCPETDAEERFLTLLGSMDFAEVADENMLLTNEAGESLFFLAL